MAGHHIPTPMPGGARDLKTRRVQDRLPLDDVPRPGEDAQDRGTGGRSRPSLRAAPAPRLAAAAAIRWRLESDVGGGRSTYATLATATSRLGPSRPSKRARTRRRRAATATGTIVATATTSACCSLADPSPAEPRVELEPGRRRVEPRDATAPGATGPPSGNDSAVYPVSSARAGSAAVGRPGHQARRSTASPDGRPPSRSRCARAPPTASSAAAPRS